MTTAEEARIILEDCELNNFDKLVRYIESRILNAAKDGKEYVNIPLREVEKTQNSLPQLTGYLKEYGYVTLILTENVDEPSLLIGW